MVHLILLIKRSWLIVPAVAMSEADEALGRDSGVVVVDNGSTDQARVDEMNVDGRLSH